MNIKFTLILFSVAIILSSCTPEPIPTDCGFNMENENQIENQRNA